MQRKRGREGETVKDTIPEHEGVRVKETLQLESGSIRPAVFHEVREHHEEFTIVGPVPGVTALHLAS